MVHNLVLYLLIIVLMTINNVPIPNNIKNITNAANALNNKPNKPIKIFILHTLLSNWMPREFY